jgi:choline dehydrogenase-like flavoprotein
MAQDEHLYDVVIIGTGVAGALAAYELKKAGLDVLILEAGDLLPRDKANTLLEQRRTMREKYAKSSTKAPTSPYVGYVAPQPNYTDAVLNGSDYYDQEYNTKDNGKLFGSYYQRTVGGSMMHWQGIALRMVPSDFSLTTSFGLKGSNGEHLDWPIRYEDLEPYYHRAEWEMGVAGSDEMDKLLGVPRKDGYPSSEERYKLLGAPRKGGYPMDPIEQSYVDLQFKEALMRKGRLFSYPDSGFELPPTVFDLTATPQARNTREYDGRRACEGYSTCIPLCPSGAKYESLFHVEKAVKQGAKLLAKTIATRLEVDGGSPPQVVRAHYKTWDKVEGSVRGKLFIVAANGIETPKLLLMSNKEQQNGVANGSQLVGCYLMDHPLKGAYALAKTPVYPFRGPPATSGIETFRDGSFRKNFAAFRTTIRNDGWDFAEKAPRGKSLKGDQSNFHATLLDLVGKRRLFGDDLKKTLIYFTQRQVLVFSACEMLPDRQNRVTLSTNTDKLDVPMPKITFDIGDYARKGLKVARQLHQKLFDAIEVDESWLEMWGDISKGGVSAPDLPDLGSGHIIGTTRMGTERNTSVVDSYGRAHEAPNLFIMGSSVFPTSAVANPTLTIAALVLRASQHIRETFRRL